MQDRITSIPWFLFYRRCVLVAARGNLILNYQSIREMLILRWNRQKKVFENFYKNLTSYNPFIVLKNEFIPNFCFAANREEEDKFERSLGELQPLQPRMRPSVYCRVVFASRLLTIAEFKRGVFSQLRLRGGGRTGFATLSFGRI